MCTNTALIMLAMFAGVLALLWRSGWIKPPNPLADWIDDCLARRKEKEMRDVVRELADDVAKKRR